MPVPLYADPVVRLRTLAAAILADLQANACNYDRPRVTLFMRLYAIRQGAALSVTHSGAYGIDVQLSINEALGATVAPSTCSSMSAPFVDADAPGRGPQGGGGSSGGGVQPTGTMEISPAASAERSKAASGSGPWLWIGAGFMGLLLLGVVVVMTMKKKPGVAASSN